MNKKFQYPLIFRLTAFYMAGFLVCTYGFGDFEFTGAICSVKADHCEDCLLGVFTDISGNKHCSAFGGGSGTPNFKTCVPTVTGTDTCSSDPGGPQVTCENMDVFYCGDTEPVVDGTDTSCDLNGGLCPCEGVRDSFFSPIPGADGCT